MENDRPIVTLKAAKARGLTRYFSAKPCKKGHVCERQTSNGNCVACNLEKVKDYRAANPEKARESDRRRRASNLEKERDRDRRHYAVKRETHPEYVSWCSMKQRCTNPNHKFYENYGGRGIRVSDRWRYGENGQSGFECFIADMGRRPTPQHSIDRIDVNGIYEPGNVRWSTAKEQAANHRKPRRAIKAAA